MGGGSRYSAIDVCRSCLMGFPRTLGKANAGLEHQIVQAALLSVEVGVFR